MSYLILLDVAKARQADDDPRSGAGADGEHGPQGDGKAVSAEEDSADAEAGVDSLLHSHTAVGEPPLRSKAGGDNER